MSSYRYEERGKSHANGHRLRDDVRYLNKDEEPRGGREGRGDGFRRSSRGGNFNFSHTSATYEPEVERHIHVTRHNDTLIVRIPNDHYQPDPNGKPNINRRGQGSNNNNISNNNNGTIGGVRPSQGPLRASMRNSNNDGQNQPRPRFETSERHRNRPFREYSDNTPYWKSEGSGYNGGQPRQGSVGSRGIFNSAWVSVEGSRNLGGRRSGKHNDGVDGGSRGMRRRGGGGGGGDNVVVSFRVPENEHQNDRDNKMGDRSHHSNRGGFHRRGSMRGSRSCGGRGGRGAGFSSRGHDDNRPTSKLEDDDHTPELEKQDNAVNPEDSNSTDEDKYQLNVDMKTFTVTDPLISDPILTVPLSAWSKGDLVCVSSQQTDETSQSEEISDGGMKITSGPPTKEPEISKTESEDGDPLEASDERVVHFKSTKFGQFREKELTGMLTTVVTAAEKILPFREIYPRHKVAETHEKISRIDIYRDGEEAQTSNPAPKIVRFEDEGKQEPDITEGTSTPEKQVSNSAQAPIESEKENNVVNVEELGGSLEKEDLEVSQEIEEFKVEMEQKPILIDPNQPEKSDGEETEQNPTPVSPTQSSQPNDSTNQESVEEGVTSFVSVVTNNNQSPSVPSGSDESNKSTAPKTNSVSVKKNENALMD
ncbi:unnamed protein product [Hymenolepis diminuta]|uniref:Uncharacterized protein n=1 Tax=Hymenolepis diminuta TaxID=6216 RepID=A0A564Z761_HYMDI|nr:unnamed protein product [Hymenolepis diminuta]